MQMCQVRKQFKLRLHAHNRKSTSTANLHANLWWSDSRHKTKQVFYVMEVTPFFFSVLYLETRLFPKFSSSMGNHYSTQELKQKIHQDLRIDVAFPFFPLNRKTGSSACCVVRKKTQRRNYVRANNHNFYSGRYRLD